ncbi:hypothetical protein GCM10028826_22320 [Mucilaginibacter boryungensis]
MPAIKNPAANATRLKTAKYRIQLFCFIWECMLSSVEIFINKKNKSTLLYKVTVFKLTSNGNL